MDNVIDARERFQRSNDGTDDFLNACAILMGHIDDVVVEHGRATTAAALALAIVQLASKASGDSAEMREEMCAITCDLIMHFAKDK
jgi:hypothetical protein